MNKHRNSRNAKLWECDAFPDNKIGWQIREDIKGGWMNYAFHPLFSWRAKPNLRLPTLETNEFGLRSKSFKSLKNLKCILLGGSFGWGYGATSNASIPSYQIEDALSNKYNLDMSVINMADQMFCSIQQIQSVVFSLYEIKPSLILCVTGYNDIGQGYLGQYTKHHKFTEYCSFLNWAHRTGIMFDGGFLKKLIRFLSRGHRKWEDPYPDNFTFTNVDKNDIPLALFKMKYDILNAVCLYKNIKIIYVLEPCLYYKKHLSDYESAFISSEDKPRMKYYMDNYDMFRDKYWNNPSLKSSNISFIDTTGYFDDIPKTVFIDSIHTSDKGYKIWSDKLSENIYNIWTGKT